MIDLSAGIDTEEAIRQLRKLQQEAKRVTSNVVTDSDRMDMAMRRLGNTIAKLGVGISLGTLVRQIAHTRGEFQQLEVAFTTLLQSKEKADSLMKQMVDLAATTPFDLQGVADGARQLLAYGFAADDITDTLTRLGNVAAGLGLPLERLTYLYGTTAVQGRVYARDMLQFTGSGIPVLQEMAKMYGKTTEEINAMVSAGKIGFEDVKKVIENMTNAGGQFYNLMGEQSKTINGLISNLGDAIDSMFNEIGKSQETVISSALKGAIALAENYEKVLDVLLPLVAAYGAYKAVLITTAAIQKTKATVEAVRLMMMYRKELGLATAAQQAFNVSLKANPLGLALSLLTLIGTAVWRYASGAQDAAENTLGLARANKKASEEIDTETSKLQALQDVVNNANNSYEARKKALDKLKEIVPSYHAELTAEGQLINNNTDALQKYLKEFEKNIRIKAAQEELEEAYRQKRLQEKELGKAQESLESIKNRPAKNVYQTNYANYGADAFREVIDTHNAEQRVKDAEEAIAKADKAIQELNNEITQQSNLVETNGSKTIVSAAKNLQDAQKAYNDAVKIWKTAIKEGEDVSLVEEKKNGVDAAKKALDEAKKLAGINEKTTKTQEKLSDSILENDLDLQRARIAIMQDGRNKRLAEIDLEYQQTMARINKNRTDAVKNNASNEQLVALDEQVALAEQKRLHDRAKVEKEYAKQTAETYRQTADVFLSEEERRTRSIERTYQAMRDKIVEDLQAGNISNSDFVLLNEQIDRAEEREMVRNQLEKWRKYAQDRLKIEEDFQRDVARIREQQRGQEGEDEIERLREIRDNDLVALAEEMGMKEDEFTAIVDRVVNMGLEQILAMIPQVQEAINALGDDIDPTVRAKLQAQLTALKVQANNLNTGKDSGNTAKKSTKDWKELQEVLNGVSETFGEVGDAIDGTAGEIVSAVGGIATSAASMLNGIEAIKTATSGLDKASAALMVVSVGLQLVTGLFSLFSKSHELSKETIKSYEAYMDTTDDLIDKQKELLEVMTGVQALMASEAGVEAIKKQEEATRNLGKAYLASRAKNKHSYGVKTEERLRGYRDVIEYAGFDWDELYGSGRMEGLFDLSASEIERFKYELPEVWAKLDEDTRKYLDTLIECEEKMNELGEATAEALTGFSLDDARDELLDFLNDMDVTFDDVAGNFENTMMNAINRVIASQMDGRLREWYEDFSKAMEDGTLSEEEREKLKREYENIYRDSLQEREQFYSIAGIDSEASPQQQQASSNGFQTMSQDTGNELNGRFTAILENTTIIKNTLELMRSLNVEHLSRVTDIRDIAIQLNGNVADIRDVSVSVVRKVLPEMAANIASMDKTLKTKL